jgi:hypothetical protein
MQTFADLHRALAGVGRVLRASPHVRTMEIATPPLHHVGLGAVVRCRDGWALRLALPVAEVQVRTLADAMQRLAYEVVAIQGTLARSVDHGGLRMWAE